MLIGKKNFDSFPLSVAIIYYYRRFDFVGGKILLSDTDIYNELGENIFIAPFNRKNIRGNTINFTASNMAWSLAKQESVVKDGKIEIPAHDTVLVETAEVLHVTQKIGGTYHSKVAIVSKGIGHIGTTLDPGWIGQSLIALHNPSDKAVCIRIGDSIVSVIFYYVHSEARYKNTNQAGQVSVLHSLGIMCSTSETETFHEEWRSNTDLLKEEMFKSPEYKEMCEERKHYNRSLYITKKAGVYGVVFFLFMFFALVAYRGINLYFPITPSNPYTMIIIAIFSGAATQWYPQIAKWAIEFWNVGNGNNG